MPMYSKLKDFVKAINTGKTHITDSLDTFFGNLAQVTAHPHWADLAAENWAGGPPGWLGGVLDGDIHLTPPERNHVLAWPGPELEKARAAVVRAVAGVGGIPPASPKFFWELYNGPGPRTVTRVSTGGNPEIVFQSPKTAVVMEGDEVFVRDVPL